ncbi:hypothetical protein SAMN04488498_111142 [Mesorhizobium albiziae]|uniref:Uncharacterized protein n=1 Tax=Neomesorhizobium albiziae TaxID=335020 RepID=A0A1I4C1B3_9HYPH|nr:hypothetical protein [Mesorhizobium albiziae]GLS29591.1 hypothetical protein GCM10007937_12990 [Mesorhizobium albiziae]SFK73941.1 hypothetical protein SAMN04488498_111142 [Mesorhizobium albiziae]
MATSVISRTFLGTGIIIDERIVEIQNGEVNIRFESRFPDAASMILIQYLSGEPETQADIPLDEIGEPQPTGRFFSGIMQGARAVVGLASAGFTKARVIFAQIRPGTAAVIDGLPCTFCTLAVKTIISAILVHLGIPPLPGGDFDLTAVIDAVQDAGADIMDGGLGGAVQSLVELLPQNALDLIMEGLEAFDWIFDLQDHVGEWVCQQLGMCPAAP